MRLISGNIIAVIFILAALFTNTAANQVQYSASDSSGIADSIQAVPLRFIETNTFTIAGDRRHTITGELPNDITTIRPVPAAIVGGIYIGTLVYLHFHQQNAWWSGTRGGFHFEEDWVSALQVDKAGHAFGGYIMNYMLTEGLAASGFSWKTSNILGTVLGLGYQTYIEIEDGFAKDWGFSPSDWAFDAIGPIFHLSQHYVPALQSITPKWQYIPSEWAGKPVIMRPRTFIDDYNSSTFWWSLNVYDILPEKGQRYWPGWLNLAVGYGGDAIDANPDPNGPPDQLSVRRYIVGLDVNLIRLIPDTGGFLDWAKQTLNFIKLPAPALEFSKGGTKFHLLYPFRINIGDIKF